MRTASTTDDLTDGRLSEIEFQLMLFGYAVQGSADDLAWVCETGQDPPSGKLWWDRRAEDLIGTRVTQNGKDQPVPLWWALPGVVEHETRR